MTTDSSPASAQQIVAEARLQRSRRRWRFVAFLAILIAVIAVTARLAAERGIGTAQIARVEISGTIASDRDRLALLKKLGEDDNVKAVLVAINSPGGTTAGGEELYEALGKLLWDNAVRFFGEP